ncbi:MAG: DMT family transporter [Bacillota bacterium]|jgi:paired small multidrug resistance pump
MGWLLVFISGIIEIFWAIGLKLANNVWEFVIVGIVLVVGFFPLVKSYELLPVSIAYMVYTGIGTVGVVLVETFYLQVPIDALKIFFIAMIIGGMVGLKFVDAKYEKELAEAKKQETAETAQITK